MLDNAILKETAERQLRTSPLLSRGQWAWQFLMRNPKFQEDLSKACQYCVASEENPYERLAVGFFEPGIVERWGVLFADLRSTDANTSVIWEPRVNSEVLHVTAVKGRADVLIHALNLSEATCRTTVLRATDGVQHVLIEDQGRRLQLAIRGADVRGPVFVFVHPKSEQVRQNTYLAELRKLNGVLTRGRLPSKSTTGNAPKLERALLALDGWQGGFTPHEIAARLFGANRVRESWDDSDGVLQTSVGAAIGLGRALMEGGYRRLLA
jgi:hypothetical protein